MVIYSYTFKKKAFFGIRRVGSILPKRRRNTEKVKIKERKKKDLLELEYIRRFSTWTDSKSVITTKELYRPPETPPWFDVM